MATRPKTGGQSFAVVVADTVPSSRPTADEGQGSPGQLPGHSMTKEADAEAKNKLQALRRISEITCREANYPQPDVIFAELTGQSFKRIHEKRS
jgi:hypothetical protein